MQNRTACRTFNCRLRLGKTANILRVGTTVGDVVQLSIKCDSLQQLASQENVEAKIDWK